VPEILEVDPNALEQWFTQNLILLLIVGGILVLIYAFSSRIVHATVTRTLSAQSGALEEGGVEEEELAKRAATLESLIRTVLRVSVISIAVIIIIGLLDLWSLLTGIGLVVAALTLAGQPIVLDYLMGILIIMEAQFFKGDNIMVGELFGTVENVGLRRTVIRTPDGNVVSLSNGELRVVYNRTRVFAAAEVKVRGIRDEDLDRVIEIMDRVGQDIAADPEFSEAIMEAHALQFIANPDDLGNTAIFRGKVRAGDRWRVATEARRRLNRAFLEEGVELNKRGIAPRIPRGAEAPPYVPEPEETDQD
jgi:small conductance mechanosensitive channel